MPLTHKGKVIEKAMEKEYGEKKGKSLFYASKNKGTIKGVEAKKKALKNVSKECYSCRNGMGGCNCK